MSRDKGTFKCLSDMKYYTNTPLKAATKTRLVAYLLSYILDSFLVIDLQFSFVHPFEDDML